MKAEESSAPLSATDQVCLSGDPGTPLNWNPVNILAGTILGSLGGVGMGMATGSVLQGVAAAGLCGGASALLFASMGDALDPTAR